jgi:glycosyltransferase involved in cell wall biosynthesis
MRVLMVTPSYYPILGGTETYVAQLARALNQKGVSADVMTLNMATKFTPENRDEERQENGFKLFRVSAHNPRLFNFHGHSPYGELLNAHVIPRPSFAREFDNYDVIHFHDDTDFTFPLYSYLAHKTDKPRILHLHTIPYTYEIYKRNLLLRILLRRVADLYVGLSEFTIPFMLKLGLPEDKLTVLPNAVDTNTFRPNDKIRMDNAILFVGRIIRTKGVDTLLEALFKVKTSTQVYIIGPVTDKSFFLKVQRLIQKINETTSHKAVYLGPLHGNALTEWYQRATIFAAPARADHFPITNLEALACETPIIASPVGAVTDMVHDKVNGLLVPPGETLPLSSALNLLLENRKLRESYGRKGREIVENYFSWTVVSERIINIYDRLVKTKYGALKNIGDIR